MLKIYAAALLATSLYAGAASAAGGGGGAEPMPLTNYTDMPSYHPCCRPAGRIKHARKDVRRYYNSVRGR
jgi:hypothetical protein